MKAWQKSALLALIVAGLAYWFFANDDHKTEAEAVVPEQAAVPKNADVSMENLKVPSTPEQVAAPKALVGNPPDPDDNVDDLCEAESAQEVWYRLQSDVPAANVIERNLYYQARSERLLVVKQNSGGPGSVSLNAAWRDTRSGNDGPFTNVSTEKNFLDAPSALSVLGSSWTSDLSSFDPVLIEETISWGEGNRVMLHNDTAIELHMMWKRPGSTGPGMAINCPPAQSCSCAK